MDQVLRSGQTQLRVFVVGSATVQIVVAGIGQVIGIAKFLQARIFYAAAFFVGRVGLQNWLGALGKMNSVAARGISQRRFTGKILCAIQHHEPSVFLHYRGVECSS